MPKQHAGAKAEERVRLLGLIEGLEFLLQPRETDGARGDDEFPRLVDFLGLGFQLLLG